LHRCCRFCCYTQQEQMLPRVQHLSFDISVFWGILASLDASGVPSGIRKSTTRKKKGTSASLEEWGSHLTAKSKQPASRRQPVEGGGLLLTIPLLLSSLWLKARIPIKAIRCLWVNHSSLCYSDKDRETPAYQQQTKWNNFSHQLSVSPTHPRSHSIFHILSKSLPRPSWKVQTAWGDRDYIHSMPLLT